MFTVCLRYGHDRHDAEEILQEGFIKVFSSLHQFRGEGSLEGWIRRVIVTTALQHLRSRMGLRAVHAVERLEDHDQQNDVNIESSLTAKELLVLIRDLPTACRLVFNLYVFEGYKHKDIAEILQITEGTSKSNLFDARRMLKKKVEARHQIDKLKSNCL